MNIKRLIKNKYREETKSISLETLPEVFGLFTEITTKSLVSGKLGMGYQVSTDNFSKHILNGFTAIKGIRELFASEDVNLLSVTRTFTYNIKFEETPQNIKDILAMEVLDAEEQDEQEESQEVDQSGNENGSEGAESEGEAEEATSEEGCSTGSLSEDSEEVAEDELVIPEMSLEDKLLLVNLPDDLEEINWTKLKSPTTGKKNLDEIAKGYGVDLDRRSKYQNMLQSFKEKIVELYS